MRLARPVLLFVAASMLALVGALPVAAQGPLVAAWTQAEPDGAYSARLITRSLCPQIEVDDKPLVMHERAAPGKNFDARTCAAPLPRDAKRISVLGRELPLPPRRLRTIAVLGDSGCRIEIVFFQACNDPNMWPFPAIAQQVADQHPDLIIHLGDYYYRETPCFVPACAGSPHGDGIKAWAADLLTPAAPMFAAAPMLFVRGNHEDCERGGHGWDRFLSVYPYGDCAEREPAWVTTIDGLRFFVLDSSSALDPRPRTSLVPEFRSDFARLRALPPAPTWLLTHRPMWGFDGQLTGGALPMNRTLEAAERDPKTLPVELALSGHVNLFEALSFADRRPPQVIVGTGGDTLSDNPGPLVGLSIDKTKVVQATMRHGFGFTIFDVDTKTIAAYDRTGKKVFACRYAPGTVLCHPE